MKLEDQVCSLELAKRLKELGVKQESYFSCELGPSSWDKQTPCVIINRGASGEYFCSAFTVAELGEMLPRWVFFKFPNGTGHNLFVDFEKQENWRVHYRFQGSTLNHMEEADTEADARAKMLIYLIEQGLLKP